MSSAAVDYRVSRLIVLCKDCGDDVGLYPSRHKCRKPERPPLPTLVVPKEEQVVTTYWEMLKSTLWSAEESTKASKESPGGLIWNKMMDATTTVARVVGVVTSDESDSDEDENGETKVTKELKAYYEKKGEGMPKFLLNNNDRTEQGVRKDGGHPNWNNDSRQAKNGVREQSETRVRIVKKTPIPIRKAPLREEDDEQEQMRRREKEQAEQERVRETQRDVEAERKREAQKRADNRKRTEREAALAALDGTRDTSYSARSVTQGSSPEPIRVARNNADQYNERWSPQPLQALYGPSPSANERSRVPAHQPKTYDQQPYTAPPPALMGSVSKLMQPHPTGSGSLIPPEYSWMRPKSPNRSHMVNGTERRLRDNGGGVDAGKPLIDRRVMMNPGQPVPRYAMREPRRKDPRILGGGQGVQTDLEERYRA